MPRKKNKNLTGLDEMLGLGFEIGGFLDEKPRNAIPIKMKNFSEFMGHVSQIDFEALWTNFLYEQRSKSVEAVLEMTFIGHDIDELMENINAQNYSKIMKAILKINDIEFNKGNEEESTGENNEGK